MKKEQNQTEKKTSLVRLLFSFLQFFSFLAFFGIFLFQRNESSCFLKPSFQKILIFKNLPNFFSKTIDNSEQEAKERKRSFENELEGNTFFLSSDFLQILLKERRQRNSNLRISRGQKKKRRRWRLKVQFFFFCPN